MVLRSSHNPSLRLVWPRYFYQNLSIHWPPTPKLARTRAEKSRLFWCAARPKSKWPLGPVKILDGTMPDRSEHRLGVLRQIRAAGLPAQAVIVYDLATGLCDSVAVRLASMTCGCS